MFRVTDTEHLINKTNRSTIEEKTEYSSNQVK